MGKINSGQVIAEGVEIIKIEPSLVFSRGRKRDHGDIGLAGRVGVGERADELHLRTTFVDRIDAT